MGLFPVVGVPLPLISYGGTVMITTMVGFEFHTKYVGTSQNRKTQVLT